MGRMVINMEPRFPIFLKDKDGWMYLIDSAANLGRLECVDVEEKEYTGWDVDGRHIGLGMNGDEITSTLIADGVQCLDELAKSIIDFANKMGPKGDPFHVKNVKDVLELFATAEKHANKSKLWNRFLSFIGWPTRRE